MSDGTGTISRRNRLSAQFNTDPAGVAALYDDWVATRYDADLARWSYDAPARIAELVAGLLDHDGDDNGDGAILDAGCGSGLVGVELDGRSVGRVIGGDFSLESVEVARARGVDDDVVQLDLNAPLNFGDAEFRAVVNAGVFTYLTASESTNRKLLRVVDLLASSSAPSEPTSGRPAVFLHFSNGSRPKSPARSMCLLDGPISPTTRNTATTSAPTTSRWPSHHDRSSSGRDLHTHAVEARVGFSSIKVSYSSSVMRRPLAAITIDLWRPSR